MSLFVSGHRDDAVRVAEKADAFIGEVKAQNDAVLITAELKYHSASDEHSKLNSELTRLKSFFDEHLAQVQAPKNQLNLQSEKELTERHNVDSFIQHADVVESDLCVELADKPEKAFRWTGETIVDADHDYLNDLQAFDFYSDDESQVEDLDQLVENVDGTNSKKTCNYLSSSARYLAGPDNMLVLDIAFMVYLKFEEYSLALQIALYLDNREYMSQVFTSCDDLFCKRQFCYTIARHVSNFELSDEMVAEDEEREALQDIINNTKLSEGYLTPAWDIEVMEAKTPEDIYKAHLVDGRASAGASNDSA